MTIKFTGTEDEQREKRRVYALKMNIQCGHSYYIQRQIHRWSYTNIPNLEFSCVEPFNYSELKIIKRK